MLARQRFLISKNWVGAKAAKPFSAISRLHHGFSRRALQKIELRPSYLTRRYYRNNRRDNDGTLGARIAILSMTAGGFCGLIYAKAISERGIGTAILVYMGAISGAIAIMIIFPFL